MRAIIRDLQGVSKGGMVEAILTAAARTGSAPDFVLCIGDDRSDEDMFTAMEHVTFSPHLPAEVSRVRAGSNFIFLHV
jgi:trehalose-6-phosphatase